MLGHAEYHDVCQQVVPFDEGSNEENKMDIDQLAADRLPNAASTTADGRFEQSALQQVIYVKRKAFHENDDNSGNLQNAATSTKGGQLQSVTSVAHLAMTDEISEADLQTRAVQALEKLI